MLALKIDSSDQSARGILLLWNCRNKSVFGGNYSIFFVWITFPTVKFGNAVWDKYHAFHWWSKMGNKSCHLSDISLQIDLCTRCHWYRNTLDKTGFLHDSRDLSNVRQFLQLYQINWLQLWVEESCQSILCLFHMI